MSAKASPWRVVGSAAPSSLVRLVVWEHLTASPGVSRVVIWERGERRSVELVRVVPQPPPTLKGNAMERLRVLRRRRDLPKQTARVRP